MDTLSPVFLKKVLYIYNYFVYRLKAVNEHGVHSPFVFDLLTNVIYNRNQYYCFKKIEKVREQLLNSKKTKENKVGQLTKQYSTSPKYAQLLFRLVNHFQPSHIVELDNSFGITAAYMASVNSENKIITIEESPKIAEIAKQNFKQLSLKNIEQKTGSIDAVLKAIAANCQSILFVRFDGNHCKQDTLNYFYLCLEKANEVSVFVFENMYSTSEMKQAWNEIKNNTRVKVTVDLFFMGIVFFKKEQVKQHFLIRF